MSESAIERARAKKDVYGLDVGKQVVSLVVGAVGETLDSHFFGFFPCKRRISVLERSPAGSDVRVSCPGKG